MEGGGSERARELTMERTNEFVFIYDGNGISSSQYNTLLHQASPRAVFFFCLKEFLDERERERERESKWNVTEPLLETIY